MADKFGSKFKFTKDDLYNMVVGALKQESTQPNAGNTPKPNLLQGLLAKAKLPTKANQ